MGLLSCPSSLVRVVLLTCFILYLLYTDTSSFTPFHKTPPSMVHYKPIVIQVDQQVKNYQNTFNHPWHLLYLTRSCARACSFISIDKKFERPFTQYRLDHVWLDSVDTTSSLSLEPDAILGHVSSTDEFNTKSVKDTPNLMVYIQSRLSDPTYNHTTTTLDPSHLPTTPITLSLSLSHSSPQSTPGHIYVGHGPQSHLHFTFITQAYRDVYDFSERIQDMYKVASMPWSEKKGVIAFLPECSKLPSSHIEYLKKFISLTDITVFSGCLSSKPIPPSIPDDKRMKLVAGYKFILHWETRHDVVGYISEQYYRLLAYDAIPIVLGPLDLHAFTPIEASKCLVDVRDYADSPEGLASVVALGIQEESWWASMMSWKSKGQGRGLELQPSFKALWEYSLESTVCRLCDYVAKEKYGIPIPDTPLDITDWLMNEQTLV